jgi:hypothetical protein
MSNDTLEKFIRMLAAIRTSIGEGGVPDTQGSIQATLDELSDALQAEVGHNKARELAAAREFWRRMGPNVAPAPIDVPCTVTTTET